MEESLFCGPSSSASARPRCVETHLMAVHFPSSPSVNHCNSAAAVLPRPDSDMTASLATKRQVCDPAPSSLLMPGCPAPRRCSPGTGRWAITFERGAAVADGQSVIITRCIQRLRRCRRNHLPCFRTHKAPTEAQSQRALAKSWRLSQRSSTRLTQAHRYCRRLDFSQPITPH